MEIIFSTASFRRISFWITAFAVLSAFSPNWSYAVPVQIAYDPSSGNLKMAAVFFGIEQIADVTIHSASGALGPPTSNFTAVPADITNLPFSIKFPTIDRTDDIYYSSQFDLGDIVASGTPLSDLTLSIGPNTYPASLIANALKAVYEAGSGRLSFEIPSSSGVNGIFFFAVQSSPPSFVGSPVDLPGLFVDFFGADSIAYTGQTMPTSYELGVVLPPGTPIRYLSAGVAAQGGGFLFPAFVVAKVPEPNFNAFLLYALVCGAVWRKRAP